MKYFIEIYINYLHVIKLTLVVELHLSEKVFFLSYISSQLEHYSLTIYSLLTIQKAI